MKLTCNELRKASAVQIGTLTSDAMFYFSGNRAAGKVPGFYFIVRGNEVIAMTFVANQRSGSGFNAFANDIHNRRTSPTYRMAVAAVAAKSLKVFHVDYDNMKHLLNPNCGKVKMFFTRTPYGPVQNFEEIKQAMHDIYTFQAQPTRA
ncbi:nuclear disruption protein [Serratia phage Muldoon]|uniref:Nucleoid disruption protein n=1 Tax=Serratia phage Muldoon TaxID=2601678 RepID=A0A5P8PHL6_9CAUD|nr:Ndd-like nucleoid disruption protein [Serratia phage Muldoon]QFR56207.1 nuclear disruption protein [Serratia phage Muldoon]